LRADISNVGSSSLPVDQANFGEPPQVAGGAFAALGVALSQFPYLRN